MMNTRLHTVDAELADVLLATRSDALKSATVAALEAALPKVVDRDGTLRLALNVLRSTDGTDRDLCVSLRELAGRLDAEYFDLADAADVDTTNSPGVLIAFSRGRFASALAFACDGGPVNCIEAVYELQAATDSWEPIRSAVVNALQ